MATLQFNLDGSINNIQYSGPDKAVIGQQEVPYISGSQLRQYAATIYSEASFMGLVQQTGSPDPIREMQRETFAVAYTMYNYTMAKGRAFKAIGKRYGLQQLLVDSSYTKGINSAGHQEYFGSGGDETRRKLSTLAVIKLFTGQTQDVQDVIRQLNGAQYWDGSDLFRIYKKHFRARYGFELSNPAHGRIYQNVSVIKGTQVIASTPAQNSNVASKRQFTYLSTMTAGGTIFFKIHPQAASQGVTW